MSRYCQEQWQKLPGCSWPSRPTTSSHSLPIVHHSCLGWGLTSHYVTTNITMASYWKCLCASMLSHSHYMKCISGQWYPYIIYRACQCQISGFIKTIWQLPLFRLVSPGAKWLIYSFWQNKIRVLMKSKMKLTKDLYIWSKSILLTPSSSLDQPLAPVT